MQPTKSYMLPKLISLNMLALMVMSFEHDAPAERPLLLSHAQSGEINPATPVAQRPGPTAMQLASATPQPSPLVKVSAHTEEHPTAIKRHTTAKKRVSHSHSAAKSHPKLQNTRYAANSPQGCCFRGNPV